MMTNTPSNKRFQFGVLAVVQDTAKHTAGYIAKYGPMTYWTPRKRETMTYALVTLDLNTNVIL